MLTERTSIGLDVHARSVAAAAIDTHTGVLVERKLTPNAGEIAGFIRRQPSPAAVAYEAGPTGYGLSRYLNDPSVSQPLLFQRTSRCGRSITSSRCSNVSWRELIRAVVPTSTSRSTSMSTLFASTAATLETGAWCSCGSCRGRRIPTGDLPAISCEFPGRGRLTPMVWVPAFVVVRARSMLMPVSCLGSNHGPAHPTDSIGTKMDTQFNDLSHRRRSGFDCCLAGRQGHA